MCRKNATCIGLLTFASCLVTGTVAALSLAQPAAAQGVSTLLVYDEAEQSGNRAWIPAGWMPDGSGISFRDNYQVDCHGGQSCIQLGYNPNQSDWVGLYWLAGGEWEGPGINIYHETGRKDISSAKLTFWARGEEGGESVQFKVGGVSQGDDSILFPVETRWIRLVQDWTQYSIDLSREDLSNLVGGFCWVTNVSRNRGRDAVWVYLDDIQYELE